jgi:DNA-binding NarL/FixJ family response regulator
MSDEDAVRQRLDDAQRTFAEGTRRLRAERQQAVMEALNAGWTKYKIAATMGIKGPTLDSIITAAEREAKVDD